MTDPNQPSAIFQQLAKRARPSVLFDIPARSKDEKPTKVALVILTQTEHVQCTANAQKVANEACKEGPKDTADHSNGEGWREIFREEKMLQILAKALRDPSSKNYEDPFVPSAKYLRDCFSTDELGVMIRAYANHRADCGPVISECTEEEADAWIALLMEGGSRLPLSRLSSDALSDLVLHLVSRLKNYVITSGSYGSPAEGSTQEIQNDGSGVSLL